MNIVLVDPPMNFEQMYGDWDLSALDTYCPPLGLLYLAAFLRENNCSPIILEYTGVETTIDNIVENIISYDPKVVGFSAKTINIHIAHSIAEGIRGLGYIDPIVVGGAHITAEPLATMERYREFDYGVIGEGEITFLKLITKIEQKKKIDNVKGIAYRNTMNQIIINPSRQLIENLDKLPFPAWDLLEGFPEKFPHNALETKTLPAASVMTSRGCPFSCTFCDRAIFGSRVRHHSAKYTLSMIRYLRNEYGIKDLMFLDDNFIMNKKKLFNICDTMIHEKIRISWYCMGHAKSMTIEKMKKIRQAGCWIIEIGIESGSDKILKSIKKNTTKDEIKKAVSIARKAGLKVKGNFIFGFPNETKNTLLESIKFATDIDINYFQQNFLTPWPGCEIAKNHLQSGRIEEWEKMSHQRITFIPINLTEHDLILASKMAFRKFYLRPKIILGVLYQSFSSWRCFKTTIIAFWVFIKTIFRK